MKRISLLLLTLAGCYEQTTNHAVPVAVVNDACRAITSEETCVALPTVSDANCEWRAVQSDCAAGATCPTGVCVTPDPCAALTDQAACVADARCAWAGVRVASPSIDLCPVGETCDGGGYCHTRDASGGGCTCVQPIVCPANADCPAVQCDCSNPATGNSGGGGTCTCDCPVCAPGEACAPCACDCSGRGACSVGATGAAVTGAGTCTCACPSCPAGVSCPPCDCACGTGNVGVANGAAGGGTRDAVADPCGGHADVTSCMADSASACNWIELGVVCVTTPCPSGSCVQMRPVPGGNCGCACPACAAGQSCQPCACECCGPTKGPVPVPE